MSSFLKTFSSGGKSGGGRSGPPLQANIALQITGHDLTAPNGGYVYGTVRAPDWMAGDEIAVRLTTPEEGVATFRSKYSAEANAKFERTRPTIQTQGPGPERMPRRPRTTHHRRRRRPR